MSTTLVSPTHLSEGSAANKQQSGLRHKREAPIVYLAAMALFLALQIFCRPVFAQNSAIMVEGRGFTIAEFHNGGKAFSNRRYIWQNVPPQLEGWLYTRTAGGIKAIVTATALADGTVWVAAPEKFELPGWQRDDSLRFNFTNQALSGRTLFKRQCKAGEVLTIPQAEWSGTLVFAPMLAEKPAPPPVSGIAVPVPGIVIYYSPSSTGIHIGSPSIVVMPNGDYIAAHDLFGAGITRNHTRIFRSSNKGKTWVPVSDIIGQLWSTLFFHRGSLFILGVNRKYGDIVIRRSSNGGKTWTTPVDGNTGLLAADTQYACGPGAMVIYKGRIWHSMEDQPSGKNARRRAFAISAPEGADLLQADNWTATNRLSYQPGWPGAGWAEGNMVLSTDKQIVNILRVNQDRADKAALIHVSSDGKKAFFNATRDFIDFPGGGSKFTIRYDPRSHRYWSLSNKQKNPSALRNVLVLTSSTDLRYWQVVWVILQDPSEAVAFQYVDWIFEGDDIIAVSATAFNGAHIYRDANYLTFHRIKNFRALHRLH